MELENKVLFCHESKIYARENTNDPDELVFGSDPRWIDNESFYFWRDDGYRVFDFNKMKEVTVDDSEGNQYTMRVQYPSTLNPSRDMEFREDQGQIVISKSGVPEILCQFPGISAKWLTDSHIMYITSRSELAIADLKEETIGLIEDNVVSYDSKLDWAIYVVSGRLFDALIVGGNGIGSETLDSIWRISKGSNRRISSPKLSDNNDIAYLRNGRPNIIQHRLKIEREYNLTNCRTINWITPEIIGIEQRYDIHIHNLATDESVKFPGQNLVPYKQ